MNRIDQGSTFMNSPNWQRLRVLHAVLGADSFSQAARQLGMSQPTVSRQIRLLEDELGETLVLATPDGIAPTEAALAMLPELEAMNRTAELLARTQTGSPSAPSVRVACGPWVATFLSANAQSIVGGPPDCQLDIVSSVLLADMPRREADVAIRTRRPESGRLRVRKIPHYRYAVYGARSLVGGREDAFDERRFENFDWAMMSEELNHFGTSKWLLNQGVKNVVLRCSQSDNLLHAVRGGSVLAVIPCFAGDPEPLLERVSEAFIPDATHIWMLLPDDVKRKPGVRQVADRLVALFESRFGEMGGAGY